MKNTILTGATALALAAPAFAGASAPYVAPEAPSSLGLSGDISLSYQNQYEFRGVSGLFDDMADEYYDDSTDVFIADVNAAYAFTENFSLVAAGRIDTLLGDGMDDHERASFGARWATDCYSIEVGYQYHDFNGFQGNVATDEIYANFGFVCPWTGADLSLFWAHDLDETDGDYVELSAVKGFELNEWASIELGAGISYSFDYWGDDYSDSSDFNHWFIGLALPLKATDNLTVTPYVTYTDGLSALDFDFGDGDVEKEEDEVLWGVKATVSF